MKIIICGGRSHHLTVGERLWLDEFHAGHALSEVITGGASGVDACAAAWATTHGIDQVVFPANWVGEGKHAGPLRNARMLSHLERGGLRDMEAIGVIAFPGGKGTASMCRLDRDAYVTVYEPAKEGKYNE